MTLSVLEVLPALHAEILGTDKILLSFSGSQAWTLQSPKQKQIFYGYNLQIVFLGRHYLRHIEIIQEEQTWTNTYN